MQDKGLFIKTFGCQMNEYDSEKIYQLLSNTHKPVDSAEKADLVFVNTCSVREKGEQKLFSLLGRLKKLKQKNNQLVIGVGGCVAQQEGQEILKRASQVDFVVGTHNLSLIPSLVKSVEDGFESQVAIDYRDEWEELPEELDSFSANDIDKQSEFSKAAFGTFYNPIRAMVAIQRGCNKRCSFCVVPNTRGPEVSREPKEILREIEIKARLGAKEVMLLGQTVNSYGKDLSPKYSFETLVEKVSEISGIERIRFTSPHPQDVKAEFVELYGKIPSLCPHIHMPLQSGSDRILKLMNRNYRVSRYRDIIESIQERCPDVAITSDIIVGFPTETEEDFQQTLDLVKDIRYSMIFSFKYSIRPNTTAKDNFSPADEVEEAVKVRRLYDLQEAQKIISKEINTSYIGKEVGVLAESKTEQGNFKGRTGQNTPIEFKVEKQTISEGHFANILVERATPNGLFGVMQ